MTDIQEQEIVNEDTEKAIEDAIKSAADHLNYLIRKAANHRIAVELDVFNEQSNYGINCRLLKIDVFTY